MSAKRPGLTHIQVSTATRDRLRAFLAKMIADQEQDKRSDLPIDPEPINPAALGVSMDWLINWLIDYKEQHRQRSREQRERERQRKAEGEAGQ